MTDIINPSLEPEIIQPDLVASGAVEMNPPLDELTDAELTFGNPSFDSASISLESAGGGIMNPPLEEP